jgi:flagellar motor switch protein FliG
MVFKGGIKEAARMLAGLPIEQRSKVIDIMAKKDPEMAEVLKKQMVTLEDLTMLTQKMLVELLREIEIADLALALRLGSDELKKFILSNVSSSIAQDIQDVLLGPPKPVSDVQESADRIMEVVLKKVAKGELIFKSDGDEYV